MRSESCGHLIGTGVRIPSARGEFMYCPALRIDRARGGDLRCFSLIDIPHVDVRLANRRDAFAIRFPFDTNPRELDQSRSETLHSHSIMFDWGTWRSKRLRNGWCSWFAASSMVGELGSSWGESTGICQTVHLLTTLESSTRRHMSPHASLTLDVLTRLIDRRESSIVRRRWRHSPNLSSPMRVDRLAQQTWFFIVFEEVHLIFEFQRLSSDKKTNSVVIRHTCDSRERACLSVIRFMTRENEKNSFYLKFDAVDHWCFIVVDHRRRRWISEECKECLQGRFERERRKKANEFLFVSFDIKTSIYSWTLF